MAMNEDVDDGLDMPDRNCYSVRICNGLYWTDEEFEAVREEVLKTPLP